MQHNFATRFEGLDGVLNSAANSYQSRFNGTSVGDRHQYLFSAGVYRQFDEKSYLSVTVNGRVQKEQASSGTTSAIDQGGNTSGAFTKNSNASSRPFVNVSVNYQQALKKINAELFTGAQYSQYRIVSNTIIRNNFNNTYLQESERRHQNFLVNVGVLRADFRKTIAGNTKWESGGNGSISGSNSIFDVSYVPVASALSSYYKYNEANAAVYTQLSATKNKISYVAGLRLEKTIVEGRYRDSSKLLVDRNYTYLFPRANISWQLDTFNQVTANYARSIHRPNYSNANQVSNYITPFLERANNININPNLTDEVSFNYQWRDYQLEATAYSTTNASWYITRYDSILKKVTMVNTNLDKMLGATLSVTLPFSYKRFISNNVLVAQIEKIQDARAASIGARPYYYIYSNNQFKLPRNFTFTLSGWMTTNQLSGIFERKGQSSVDLSLSKIFFKKLTCTINAFDIFRTLNYVESYQVNGIYSATTYLENQKEFSINVRYSFGVISDTRFKNKEVNENSNRLN